MTCDIQCQTFKPAAVKASELHKDSPKAAALLMRQGASVPYRYDDQPEALSTFKVKPVQCCEKYPTDKSTEHGPIETSDCPAARQVTGQIQSTF